MERSAAWWIGWGGIAVTAASSTWLFTASITRFWLAEWACGLTLGTAMCAYGAIKDTRWFWPPTLATALVLGAALIVAYRFSHSSHLNM